MLDSKGHVKDSEIVFHQNDGINLFKLDYNHSPFELLVKDAT